MSRAEWKKIVKGEVDLGTIHVGDTEGPDCLNVVDDLSDEIRAGTKWKSVTGAGGRGGESIYDTGEEELIQEDIKIGKTGSLRGLERGRKTGAAGLRVAG